MMQHSDKNEKSTSIRDRALGGAKVLALRTALSQVMRIGSSVVVARSLAPEDFGLFAIVFYVSGLGLYVQSFGLGPALMQKDQEPDDVEWRTAFYVQLTFAVLYFLVIFAAASSVLGIFGVEPDHATLLMVAAVQPLITSLAFVSTTKLQRDLQFSKFAAATFAGDLVGVLTACTCALTGFGVWTLVLSAVFGVIVNSLVSTVLAPWSPFGAVNFRRVLPLLRIGIPIQLSAAAPALLMGWIPFYTGRLLGPGALGFVNLSQRLAAIPMNYLQILNQVSFPAFSRLQSEPQQVISHLSAGLYRFSVVGCIGYLILAPWCPEVVALVYGDRWEPAGHLLQFFGMSTLLTALVGMLGPALNALGHGWLRLVSLVTAYGLPWLIAPLLITGLGIDGVGVTTVLLGIVDVMLVEAIVARKIVRKPELRQTVVAVVGLFVVASLVLALAGQQSLDVKLGVTFAGLAALATLWWREQSIGLEPTILWFLRRLRSKQVVQPA